MDTQIDSVPEDGYTVHEKIRRDSIQCPQEWQSLPHARTLTCRLEIRSGGRRLINCSSRHGWTARGGWSRNSLDV